MSYDYHFTVGTYKELLDCCKNKTIQTVAMYHENDLSADRIFISYSDKSGRQTAYYTFLVDFTKDFRYTDGNEVKFNFDLFSVEYSDKGVLLCSE